MNYQKKLPLAEKPKVQNDLTTSVEKKKNRTKINEKFFEESQLLKTYNLIFISLYYAFISYNDVV